MLSANSEVHLALTRVITIMLPMALLAAVLLSPGCHGSGAPAAGESGVPEPQSNPSGALDEAEASSPGELAATPRLTLPDDFPATVPLLPRRRIRSFTPREDGSISLTYSAPKECHETVDFYRRSLAALGWEVTRDSLSGGMTTLSARQEDGSRLTVNIIENPAEQQTMIGLYHRPPLEGTSG